MHPVFSKKIERHHFLAFCAVVVAVGFTTILIQFIAATNAPAMYGGNETTVSREEEIERRYESRVGFEEAIIDAVERVSPAVVSITVSKNLPIIEQCPYNPFGDLPPQFRDFFGGGFEFSRPCQKGTELQEVGGGSGFVVSEDGLVVTNKHVVAETEANYTVFMNDGKKYDAKVLAIDPVQDLALLKIQGSNFKTVPLGNSDGVRLGQTAIAIGNALGEFRNTVSVGTVSGLARTIDARAGFDTERLEGVIQTDAAINPGNSGGPLINLNGEVIGINTAIVSGAQNIGFAIPINNAKRSIQSVKKSGKIVTPYLGVHYIMLSEEIAQRDGFTVSQGALLRGGDNGPAVVKGSPADEAGLMAEDVITAVGGVAVDDEHSLVSLIQRYGVGETVPLTVVRGEQRLTITVRLGERK